MSSAERQRRYRARQKAGDVFVSWDAPAELIEALIARGWLSDFDCDDPAKILDAIADVLDCWRRGTLTTKPIQVGQ